MTNGKPLMKAGRGAAKFSLNARKSGKPVRSKVKRLLKKKNKALGKGKAGSLYGAKN